ncbi:MAG TPA: 6-carboxytetrahydropterin synthase [Thermoanaerobaculia bacterium]|jgi:6-pyruvoyltetrahydropterin/6-carboxytetrahydropterin synthase|nr:6-carboxytetrahydropterin synthase [Thermoanaerobaculia bacterium]
MPSYTLRVRVRFEAAHHLTSYKGAPEPVHGHSWQVEAVLATPELDGEGMAWDFVEIQGALRGLAAQLDHKHINTVPPFDQVSPTTERIAAWFFQGLAERLPAAPLAEVTVWEGPDCSATYRP